MIPTGLWQNLLKDAGERDDTEVVRLAEVNLLEKKLLEKKQKDDEFSKLLIRHLNRTVVPESGF